MEKTKDGLLKQRSYKYKSGFEKKGAESLERQGIPFEYETLKIKYTVPEKTRTYIPDFVLPNGVICEFKGKLDRAVREKMALVIEQNPGLDIRMLFMRDNKIAKNSKTRYSDWCKKRGIPYAISESGHIPDEWRADALSSPSLDPSPRRSVARKGRGRKRRDSDKGVGDVHRPLDSTPTDN